MPPPTSAEPDRSASAPGGAAPAPRTAGDRLRAVGAGILALGGWLFQGLAILLFVGIQLGFWLAMVGFGVGVVGGILFGWFETEPRKPPARIESVAFDRERCVIHADVVARRRLGHLDLRVAGRLGNGEGMGHFEKRWDRWSGDVADRGREARSRPLPLAAHVHGAGAAGLARTDGQARGGEVSAAAT